MKFIKKYTPQLVAIAVFVLVVLGLVVLKAFLSPSENKAIYGSRLVEQKKYIISNDTKNQVENTKPEGAESVKLRVAGRIINISVKINAETQLEAAKDIGNKIIEKFSDSEKGYYDIQIFIDKDGSTQFPIIGYKHHTTENIIWTKDRAES